MSLSEKVRTKNTLHELQLRIAKSIHAILMMLPFAVCWTNYYSSRIVAPYYHRGNWMIIALFLILYIVFGRIYDAFTISLKRRFEMVYSQVLSALLANMLMYVIIWLLNHHLPSPFPLALSFVAEIAISVIWSIFAHHWYFSSFPPRKTAVIYDKRRGMEDLIDEYGLERKFTIVGVTNVDDCLLNHFKILNDVEAVFLCGIHSHERNIILKYCISNNILVYVLPRIGDVIMSGAKKLHIMHLPILRVGRYSPPPEYLIIKRLFDIIVSGLLLIILSPFFLITSAAIKVYDHGPIFYRQKRLTKDGAIFNVLKFRSMRVDAEKDGIARLSSGEKDPRITPVGRFIRKVRIDELPQLINILLGSMSIVGPRPERPEIAEQYKKELPEFDLRLQAKAGLTGYAQVYGKYNTTPYDKLQMDLMYISNPSLLEDLHIIFATLKILFLPESTEGIPEGHITAQDEKK